MNKKDKINHIYFSDSRYEKVWEQMKLLGIQDVSTKRQEKNGTIVWKLPIRVHTAPSITKFIEVASFASGYVRNNNSGYSNYQLNKRCESDPEYFQLENGDYRRFSTRTCKLIPIEIDRLEYLISYCLKNYYIKHANLVPNGEYVPKWKLEHAVSSSSNDFNGHRDRIKDLEVEVDIYRTKLQSIIRTARH